MPKERDVPSLWEELAQNKTCHRKYPLFCKSSMSLPLEYLFTYICMVNIKNSYYALNWLPVHSVGRINICRKMKSMLIDGGKTKNNNKRGLCKRTVWPMARKLGWQVSDSQLSMVKSMFNQHLPHPIVCWTDFEIFHTALV